jgi:hypothetical protein
MSRTVVGVAVVVLVIACGPPRPAGSSDAGGSSDDEGSSAPDLPDDDEPESESESESESETEGPNFVIEPDVFEPDTCDVILQDCPAGEKCVPWASSGGTWDANKCVAVTGDQATGEPCTYGGAIAATDDCDETGFCWRVGPDAMGTCHAFCTGSPDSPECPPGSSCVLSGSGVISFCTKLCDPLLQDCPVGYGCFWDGSPFGCALVPERPPLPGEPCSFLSDCALGSNCTPASVVPGCQSQSCCAPYCDLTRGVPQCDALPGTTCEPFFVPEEAPPGYEHVGVCVLL